MNESQNPCLVAVLIPCYNEELTIANVVTKFSKVWDGAVVYVYDNNSTDNTREKATKAGAIVRSVPKLGKGNVVRNMFANIEADVYVLVDGDDTYDSSKTTQMIQMCQEGYDLVNGVRKAISSGSYPKGHQFGNSMLSWLVKSGFSSDIQDMLSGLKVMSKRFVKSFPVFSYGFEIETEITIHALELQCLIGEVDVTYSDRPEGSASKLSTFKDGYKIIRSIFNFVRQSRPLLFYSLISLILLVLAIGLGIPIVITYFQIHKVPRLPTAVLSTGLVLLASLSMTAGLIVDAVKQSRIEAKKLLYLSIKK
jgi:glycosyltransferase involved in cell wall biosynthesis